MLNFTTKPPREFDIGSKEKGRFVGGPFRYVSSFILFTMRLTAMRIAASSFLACASSLRTGRLQRRSICPFVVTLNRVWLSQSRLSTPRGFMSETATAWSCGLSRVPSLLLLRRTMAQYSVGLENVNGMLPSIHAPAHRATAMPLAHADDRLPYGTVPAA